MKPVTVLVLLTAMFLGGCYAYEYVYYEPSPPVTATESVAYIEHPDTTYVKYVEPPTVYVRYYDPWWYTPTVSWSIWCDFCFCYHKHYYDCRGYYRSYRDRPVTYPDPPQRYSRDSSVRSSSESVYRAPVRRSADTAVRSAPVRSAPVRSAPARSSAPPVRSGRVQR